MLAVEFNPRKVSDYVFFVLLPLLAVVLPLLFLALDLPIMPLITASDERLFTVFGFCMWCVLAVAAYRALKAEPGLPFEKAVCALLPILVSFFFLVLIVEYAGKSWDYENYEEAIRALAEGQNPYRSGHYIYPPLFAQAMTAVYLLGRQLVDVTNISAWLFVFYLYQCAQFFMVNLSFQLSSRLASRLGLTGLRGMLIVSGLFLFNFPLIRTLHLNQVNLILLLTTLVALLALEKYPALSGGAVMLGAMTKLYPLILGAPLLFMRKWKALLGGLLGAAILLLALTDFGRDLTLWRQFLQFIVTFPAERESSIWLRNTSILSLARNLERFAGLPEAAILPLYLFGASAVSAWVCLRLYQRDKTYRTLPPGPTREAYRNFGNLADFIGLSLLVTPSAWDHHFILALPLAIWAVAVRGQARPGWVGIATACVFVLPPFDIFPFSYLRMFGVIALLFLVSPRFRLDLAESPAA